MRKNLLLCLACILMLALPAFAQEKEMANPAAMPMTPPQPLSDDLFKWMVGEWEGWSTSPMGKSQDWQKIEWALDNQFIVIHYTAKTTEPNQEAMKAMADAAKMSKADMDKMQNMGYKGMGPMTINPQTGEVTAMWFDNMRGSYKGKGKREGNKITMTWEGPMGARTDTTEKVSEDKMVVTYTNKEPDGKVTEGRTEFTRKKGASKT